MQFLTEIRRYVAAGWKRRWAAMALAWLVCLGGWGVVFSLPNEYRANTRIYADADAILGQLLRGIAVDSAPASQVELLQKTLLSRPNLERVATRTGLDLDARSARERERLFNDMAKTVRIASQTRNLFTITYSHTNARMARDVVQALLALFMEQATSNDRQQMENARNFVNQQLAAYEAQLREAERRRAEFRARYVDLLPNDAAGGTSRLEAARGRLVAQRGELQDAIARRDALRQQLAILPAAVTKGSGGGGGNPYIADAERALRELRLQFTDRHPAVIAARDALAEMLASGSTGGSRVGSTRSATPTRFTPIQEQVRGRLFDTEGLVLSLERQVQEEEGQVERLEALARSVPQLQAQFTNLDRDYNVLRRSYEELLERRESVQIAGAARVGADRVRLEVVDPPEVPALPIGPNRMLFASIVLVAGLGAGALLAILLVQFDRGFYTVQDLRKLGLPVVGGISSTTPRKRQAGGVAVFACSALLLLLAYGAMALKGKGLVAQIPTLLARFAA